MAVSASTQNLGAAFAGCRAPAVTIRVALRRALVVRAPQLIALLIVLELGLLSPLSCVIHCLVQQLLAEPPAIGRFLCPAHGGASSGSLTHAHAHTAPDSSHPPGSTITPRALYELVWVASPLMAMISVLVAVIGAPPAPRLTPPLFPPPTPPPRRMPALITRRSLRLRSAAA